MVNKERTEQEWSNVKSQICIGDRLRGTVIKVDPYGVFVDVGFLFDGLILAPHLSSEPLKSFEDYPKVGEGLEAIVIDFQDSGVYEFRCISLSRLVKHFKLLEE